VVSSDQPDVSRTRSYGPNACHRTVAENLEASRCLLIDADASVEVVRSNSSKRAQVHEPTDLSHRRKRTAVLKTWRVDAAGTIAGKISVKGSRLDGCLVVDSIEAAKYLAAP
jgi:hypothetical protein